MSHLLFADDGIFFYKAEPREFDEVMKVVNVYGKASGQCINFEKSSLLFGKRVLVNIKHEIKSTLGIDNEGGTSRYLGLSKCFSGSKVDMLSFIKDRSQARLDNWYLRQISQGGKEILLKSTVGGMPVFAMCISTAQDGHGQDI